ncbi:MAG TPA: glycosyltransferase [Candidatus Saccharimonadales bacterium]|nr:glycosyltransferase [Candidatus Saccharimonadales bacterium]
MSGSPQKVAAVIPCYNEAASIATVIAKFPKDLLAAQGLLLEIYVINNSSTDNTAQVAAKAGAIVINEPVKGKGNALRTGFKSLPKDIDYVVMLDGDDTYSPEEVLRVLEPLRSDFCDIVVGSRLGGRIQNAAMSRLNYIGNKLFTGAVRIFYGANMTDVLTGYFAWKKSALDQLAPYITSAGFAIEMEMITKMARLGHRMASVPISYHPRTGESNLHPLRDGLRILSMLLKNILWRAPLSAAAAFTGRTIVFVSDAIYPYMKGGKEKRLHEITKRLASMGHDVHIYTMKWWQGPNKTRMESGVQLHALCRYHKMYKGDRRTISEGLLFGLACFKLFWVRFDILDVDQMPFFPIFTAWLVCVVRGRKLHATWHEALSFKEWVSYMGMGGAIAAALERLCIRLPHYITAASAHTKELLAATHGRVKGVGLVASGIDRSFIQTITTAPVHCDVLYVGRLVKDKHIDQLILATQIVREVNPEVRCVIIGDGPERNRLTQQVHQLGLESNVTFLDPLPEAAEVYSYMKAAKVFCSPSVREGFGIVSLEALGCGTPVITVDSPNNAAKHLITNGQTGSIVPLLPKALAQAILHWTSVRKKPNTTKQTQDYDWHALAQKQAEVYQA